jgi:hypothetical protein
MQTYEAKGKSYTLLPPRRRIHAAEIARAIGEARERAFTACLGLAARELWGHIGKDADGKSIVRVEPTYRGDPLDYGEAVYELLAEAGWTYNEIVLGGVAAWQVWKDAAVPAAAVKEAEGFSAAPAVETSGPAASSS